MASRAELAIDSAASDPSAVLSALKLLEHRGEGFPALHIELVDPHLEQGSRGG